MSSEKYLMVSVTAEQRDAVTELARKRGYQSTSEYVRMLIELDGLDAGVSLSLSRAWGGWRGGPKAKPEGVS